MDAVRTFQIKGWFKQGRHRQPFNKEVPALSEQQALERIYSELGSRHRIKRNLIHVDEIAALEPEEAKEPAEEEESE